MSSCPYVCPSILPSEKCPTKPQYLIKSNIIYKKEIVLLLFIELAVFNILSDGLQDNDFPSSLPWGRFVERLIYPPLAPGSLCGLTDSSSRVHRGHLILASCVSALLDNHTRQSRKYQVPAEGQTREYDFQLWKSDWSE